MEGRLTHNGVTRVLIVERNEASAEGIRSSFAGVGGAFQVEVAHSLARAREITGENPPHVVIAGDTLDDGSAIDLLPGRREFDEFPVIVVSDRDNAKSAVEAMRAGAAEFLVRTGYTLPNLPLIATRSIVEWQRRNDERRTNEFNARAARILEYLPDFVGIADSEGRMLFVNRMGRVMLGATSNSDITGERMHNLFPDWQVGEFVYADPSRPDTDVKWNPNARMKRCTGEEVGARHAVFAYVSPTSEVEYFTIVARGDRVANDDDTAGRDR